MGSAASSTAAERGNKRTLSQQVSHELIKRVIGGTYEDDAYFPSEPELARSFEVSRTVVREAVRELATVGLLDSRQGRRTTVAPREQWRNFAPSVLAARVELGAVDDLLLELLELRHMLEVEAAGLAAIRAGEQDIAQMHDQLRAMDAYLDEPELFIERDLSFHDAILRAAGNTLLIGLFNEARPLLSSAREVSIRTRPGGIRESQDGHRAIFSAIKRKKVTLARRAMAEHLSWTANLRLSDRELLFSATNALS